MQLISLLRHLTGCSLADAKATVQHLAPKAVICHRCSRVIPPELLLADCPSCGSLNLQLEAACGV
jgi:Zn finger protein HypA/HybF involved in hydrogenase expression